MHKVLFEHTEKFKVDKVVGLDAQVLYSIFFPILALLTPPINKCIEWR